MMPRGDSVYQMKDIIKAQGLSIALIFEVYIQNGSLEPPTPKKTKNKKNKNKRWGSLRILKITPKGVRRGTISTMCTISLNETRDVLIFVVFYFLWGRTTQRIRVRPWQLLTKAPAEENGKSRNYENASE